MDILKKFMFWKKDDLGLGNLDRSPLPDTNLGLEPSLGMEPQKGFGQTMGQSTQPSYPSFQKTTALTSGFGGPQPQAFESMRQEQQGYTISKEVEVISSKLDALRAAIDNLSQRLANIERLAYSEQQQYQQTQQPVQRQTGYREMPQRPY